MAEPKSASKPEAEVAQAKAEEIRDTSYDASFSAYSEVSIPKEEMPRPAPGRQVEQKRGKPSEGGGRVFSANRK